MTTHFQLTVLNCADAKIEIIFQENNYFLQLFIDYF